MSRDAFLLRDIAQSGLCSGCGLCASAAPSAQARMAYSAPGFLRPVQEAPLSAEDAETVRRACPALRVERRAPPDEAGVHPVWGYVGSCQVGWSTDADERRHGSSGGALTAVARHLVESGTARFVAHVHGDELAPTRNTLSISETAGDMLLGAGSRYGPTAPLADILQLLDRGEPFVFVGKPCDVAALRAYGEIDARIGKLVVASLSFFCGGVPSETGTQRIIDKMGLSGEPLETFRYRGDGWPGRARAVTRDGTAKELSYQETWGDILSRHVQFRCKICIDSVGESADLVFADAWFGSDDGYPLFEERDGRSLVLARNARGQAILDASIHAGTLHVEPLPLSDVDRMQPYQGRRKSAIGWRLLALKLMGRRTPRYIGFDMVRLMLRGHLVRNLKNMAGTLRRLAFRGEAREPAIGKEERADLWRGADR